jgi:hypothetical protein
MSDDDIKRIAIEQVRDAFGEAPPPAFVYLGTPLEQGLRLSINRGLVSALRDSRHSD